MKDKQLKGKQPSFVWKDNKKNNYKKAIDLKLLTKDEKKVYRCSLRITEIQNDFIKKNNLSPTKIFDDALNKLMIKKVIKNG